MSDDNDAVLFVWVVQDNEDDEVTISVGVNKRDGFSLLSPRQNVHTVSVVTLSMSLFRRNLLKVLFNFKLNYVIIILLFI